MKNIMSDLKNMKAITLISLVVTIVIIVILAAVAINVAVGNNGLIGKARYARNSYVNATEKEKQSLEDMYGEILVASDGTITLTAEKLNKIIDDKISAAMANSGDTTPVGTVIAYYSSTAPTGYLACDGAEYSISDYPELAELIKNTTGSYGTTTSGKFKVPDLRGEFLRGTGTSSYDSGTGASVGQHQNPSRIPIAGTDYAGSSTLPKYNSFNDMEFDKRYDNPTGLSGSFQGLNSRWNDTRNDYYSLRPTNTSVLYCIKCD